MSALFVSLCASAHATTLVRLKADHIAFYYDRFRVEADGNVRVSTSDGMTITGDTFSMDLKLNRFLIASNVHLQSAGGNLDGAAISDFLDFSRIYFVPVTSEPDRWTYENSDFHHPIKGRAMPGDVFYFPDLTGTQPSLTAQSAVVGEKSFVRFQGVTSYVLGAAIPLPSFYVNFGPNQDLAQNSLSGANFDLTWNVTGNNNSISAVHFRDDSVNRAYLSFEQHLAGQHEYAVFSVNPATKKQKFWNLVTGDRMGSKFQLNTFSQLYTNQTFLEKPTAAESVSYITATQALNQSYVQALATLVDYNMIGPSAPAIPNHPTSLQLSAVSFNHRVGHLPLFEQVNYGFGFNHDALGLQNYGGYEYTTVWNHVAGFTFYSPSIKFGDRDNAYKTYFFNASFNKSRQWFNVPHHVDNTSTTASISRQFSRDLIAYGSYTVANTGDYYLHGGYAPYTPIVNGNPIASYAAFRGVSTLRTAALQMVYSATPNFVVSVLARKHNDFPIAVPGLFTAPPLNVLGQYTYTSYLGQPPYDITGDVRARLLPHLVVDVQRSYFFNFGTQRWSPQFVVQLSQ